MMQTHMTAIAIGAGVLLLVILAAALLLRSHKPRLPVVPRPVLTKYETVFYRKLVRAAARVGGVEVLPQVAMGAIMDAESGLDGSTRQSVRNRFDRKIVDFVLVDREMRVVLIVELDDRTHDPLKDGMRDSITASAGYRTMRIRGAAAKDESEIERQLRSHLG